MVECPFITSSLALLDSLALGSSLTFHHHSWVFDERRLQFKSAYAQYVEWIVIISHEDSYLYSNSHSLTLLIIFISHPLIGRLLFSIEYGPEPWIFPSFDFLVNTEVTSLARKNIWQWEFWAVVVQKRNCLLLPQLTTLL